jgi:hypothetical protein
MNLFYRSEEESTSMCIFCMAHLRLCNSFFQTVFEFYRLVFSNFCLCVSHRKITLKLSVVGHNCRILTALERLSSQRLPCHIVKNIRLLCNVWQPGSWSAGWPDNRLLYWLEIARVLRPTAGKNMLVTSYSPSTSCHLPACTAWRT